MKMLGGLFLILVFLVVIVGSIWAHFDAPCSAFNYTAAKDIPGRCIMQK